MSDSELKKIVNDGFNKFKAFEYGKEALEALDALKQANSDLTKSVEALSKKRDSLLNETKGLDEKINEANEKAAFIVKTAEAKASSILGAVDAEIEQKKEKSISEINSLKNKTGQHQEKADQAKKQADEAEKRLAAINKELDAAKNRLRELVG